MFAGIDIGGTHIKGILTDKVGNILAFRTVDTPHTAREIEDAIASLIENCAASSSFSKMDIEAIGVGSAGTIDRTKGTVISSPNIPAWKRYPLVKNIERITATPVFLENDATAALLGTWWKGGGSKFRNWVLVTLGTGSGGGVICRPRSAGR